MLRFYKLMLSGFGAGWLPLAPGTWGSAAALLLAWPISIWTPPEVLQLCLLFLILAFLWIGVSGSKLLAGDWGEDPSQTVIDEMVGMWIAVLGLPVAWTWWLAAFVLFRLFDIFKPLGIRRLERLGEGWGVMLDDVLAGVYASVVLQTAAIVYG
ncbi:MAG: phosphatidylglycerophosphatase A [Saprospiraceae bacterium]|nr:phosphatidylglycerophosphatase A [Saprospiraceae bacterium]